MLLPKDDDVLYCFFLNKKSINLSVYCYRRSDLLCFCPFFCLDAFFNGAQNETYTDLLFTFSFVLIQKKQKIKENPPVGGQAPIAPRVFPGLRAAKAGG
ncbi:hypothetical protein [Hanamia caeni]|uniref:hypothetical protein n=1 Tax=Hanamia caeni TaxID=2294116 RepID=UPI00131480FF|nr:hypothetical protein [Hanamia caeni]